MERRKTGTALTDSRSQWSDSNRYVVSFDTLARSFLRRLKAEGKAQTTIARYELVLGQFEQASGERGYPWPPTGEHVSDYLGRQRDAGKAKNTVRN